MCVCFFFQAEDGIRDAQESRGLGDVYKRQATDTSKCWQVKFNASGSVISIDAVADAPLASVTAVSYTHLTLPTIYSV